jgi:hypothetical protein
MHLELDEAFIMIRTICFCTGLRNNLRIGNSIQNKFVPLAAIHVYSQRARWRQCEEEVMGRYHDSCWSVVLDGIQGLEAVG